MNLSFNEIQFMSENNINAIFFGECYGVSYELTAKDHPNKFGYQYSIAVDGVVLDGVKFDATPNRKEVYDCLLKHGLVEEEFNAYEPEFSYVMDGLNPNNYGYDSEEMMTQSIVDRLINPKSLIGSGISCFSIESEDNNDQEDYGSYDQFDLFQDDIGIPSFKNELDKVWMSYLRGDDIDFINLDIDLLNGNFNEWHSTSIASRLVQLEHDQYLDIVRRDGIDLTGKGADGVSVLEALIYKGDLSLVVELLGSQHGQKITADEISSLLEFEHTNDKAKTAIRACVAKKGAMSAVGDIRKDFKSSI